MNSETRRNNSFAKKTYFFCFECIFCFVRLLLAWRHVQVLENGVYACRSMTYFHQNLSQSVTSWAEGEVPLVQWERKWPSRLRFLQKNVIVPCAYTPFWFSHYSVHFKKTFGMQKIGVRICDISLRLIICKRPAADWPSGAPAAFLVGRCSMWAGPL